MMGVDDTVGVFLESEVGKAPGQLNMTSQYHIGYSLIVQRGL